MSLLTLSSFQANAQDLPVMGGPGGGKFRFVCPAGHYLKGLKLRSGLWIDQIPRSALPTSAIRRMVSTSEIERRTEYRFEENALVGILPRRNVNARDAQQIRFVRNTNKTGCLRHMILNVTTAAIRFTA